MTTTTIRRRVVASAVALAATGLATAIVLAPDTAAAAGSKTLTFTAVAQAHHDTSQTTFIVASVDKQGSRVIGYDVISGVVHPATGNVDLHAAFAFKGGEIYADIVVTPRGSSADGRITGGSGAYRGVHGSVTSTSSADDSRQRVTITYRR